MTHLVLQSTRVRLGAALMLALGGLVSPAIAGEKKAAAPAPAAGAAAAAKKSAWVKLCDKAPVTKAGADGKMEQVSKSICLTHHERLDGRSGLVLVSAAIREVEGSEKRSLMVMVPLGMAIPFGIRAAVYTPDQWAKAAKKEKIDEKTLKPVELKYSLCHTEGCTAEVLATPELIAAMKSGGGIMILAMNARAKPIGFPVPLTGFTAAYKGKPVDNVEYTKARKKLMAQIRERQIAAAKAYRELQKQKKPDGSTAPAAPGGGAAAPAP